MCAFATLFFAAAGEMDQLENASDLDSDSALDELRERMASGHMLTADELALLEAAAEEDEPPPTKAPPAKPTAGTSAPAKATKPSAASSSSEAAAADDDSALDELRERMASGHMLTADELALLEAAAEKEEAPSGKAAPVKPAKVTPPAKPKKATESAEPAASSKPSRKLAKAPTGKLMNGLADKPPAVDARAVDAPAVSVPPLPADVAAGAADGPGAMQPVDTPQSIAFAESIFLSEMASSFGSETLARVNGLIMEARRAAKATAGSS